ncbi:Decapping 5-like protein [Senna tora]|uniref:Decapping 5-like protein n=1 Tax=Senna tora TaxID=362788 RepID=A0A834U321_9FABA|nr:Decapping 5-like protein [Senna tora]
MATESGAKPPSTTAGESYIGSFISLISKYEIRYEGVLYHLNVQDSTIGLKNDPRINPGDNMVVLWSWRSYGTEGRRKDGPQVPPSEKVYEYILFRGNDIKVKSPPTSAKAEEQIFSDPAIIQSQYSGAPSSSPMASVGGRSTTESIPRQDTPAMSSRDLPVGLPSHQSAIQLGPSDQSAATEVSGAPSFSTPKYWPEYSGISGSSSHSLQSPGPPLPPSVVSPINMQNWMQTPETQAPSKVGWTISERGNPLSSVTASSLVNPAYEPSPMSLQTSDSLDIPSLLSSKTPMPYHASMTLSNMPSYSSPFQGINSIEGQFSGTISPDTRSIFPGHSVHHSASSSIDSTPGPLPRPPSLLTPDQFAQPRQNFFSSTQNLTPDQKHMISLTPTSSSSTFIVPSPASQAPLLPLPPLPTSVHKPQYSASQFNEEFDFEAMNEKFKKDEVWGSLGRASKTIEGLEDNAPTVSLGERECHGLMPNPNSNPAYKKDDFFDTISCNSLSHGSRNGQNRLSERMKLDSETFGNFHQRPPVGYGGYGPGRGDNYRGSYNMGRGYGYGGRGRGRNPPFY